MGGRTLPHYCEHGVPVDGGDFVDSVECKDCELTRYRNGYKGSCYACETVGEKNVELEAKLAAVEADAARYRWLRQQHWSDDTLCVVAHPKRAIRLGESCPYGSMLDAAIDAATQPEQP